VVEVRRDELGATSCYSFGLFDQELSRTDRQIVSLAR
jgi:hypothetical protein